MTPAAIGWPGGSPENTGIIIGVILGAYLAALWLTAIVWTARDIRARSADPVTQAVAVAMVAGLNLPGWVLYRVLRPPITLAELYERHLEEQALLADLSSQPACPVCRAVVSDDYVVCPHCATNLKDECTGCGKALSFSWGTCPWCGRVRPAGARSERPPTGVARVDGTGPIARRTKPSATTPPAASGGRPDGASPFRRPSGGAEAGHPREVATDPPARPAVAE